jgi:hypothetical protein
MERRPTTTQYSENAPEVSALVHPKSPDKGLKKTPKVNNVPHSVIRTRKARITII